MKLYVDDCRPVPEGWALARSVAEAVRLLSGGNIEEVSLDYVIGGGGETFLPVARYITEIPEEKRPRRVIIHTSSASGAWQMEQVLRGYVHEIVRL